MTNLIAHCRRMKISQPFARQRACMRTRGRGSGRETLACVLNRRGSCVRAYMSCVRFHRAQDAKKQERKRGYEKRARARRHIRNSRKSVPPRASRVPRYFLNSPRAHNAIYIPPGDFAFCNCTRTTTRRRDSRPRTAIFRAWMLYHKSQDHRGRWRSVS